MAGSKFATEYNFNVGGHMTAGRQGHKVDRIVIHHNANTNDVVPGVWQSRASSAHYQVTPTAVRQCVDENNTAWHAGNWAMNLRSIGIEHLNSTGAPSWQVAPETIERSAHLVADICQRYGIPCDRAHIIKHSEVPRSTACPGGLDIDKLVNRTRELMGQRADTSAPAPTPAPAPAPTQKSDGGYLSFDYRGNVRNEPTTKSGVFATYDAGAWVKFDGYVHGESVNGSDKWLRSSRSKKYVHESVTGGVYGLPDLGTVNVSAPAPNTPQTGSNGLVAQNGTYKAYFNMKIRTAPSLSAQSIDTFDKGASHSYDGYVDNEGIRWISFIGDTTKKRVYVARRKLDNSEIWGECY